MKEEVLARVFRIAYCNYFSPHLYHEWKSICENFVINVKHTMPELLNKPKVHLILHLVDCMVNLGPCSAFSAERCESFNATVRAQNIFSNRLAPSRDICNHFAVQQHLRYTCACDGDDNIHAFQNPHMYHVVLNTIGLSCATIEDLHRHDSSTTIELFHCMEDSLVAVFKGVIVADGGLVHAGDFVELLCSEIKYALFLTFCQLETGESFCVLQGCDEFVVNSEPVLNELEPPESFDFSKPDGWNRWKRRFDQFRVASGLANEDDAKQVSTLLYCLGEGAEDTLSSTNISRKDRESYGAFVKKLDDYFGVRRNVIFERARFNRRDQLEGETADEYIATLFSLAENCEYGGLKDELIRDRLVVGIRDETLSRQLQLDPELTLKSIRQREAVKDQQQSLKQSSDADPNSERDKGDINAMKTKKGHQPTQRPYRQRKCFFCGGDPHPREKCPARNSICFACQKQGHHASVCRSKQIEQIQVHSENEEEGLFVDIIGKHLDKAWFAHIRLCKHNICFKLDTGAEVTAISQETYQQLGTTPLNKPSKVLYGAGNQPLDVMGQFTGILSHKELHSQQTIFVIKNLKTNLLGLPALHALKLIARMDSVKEYEESIQRNYPQLSTGLGAMGSEYTIKLKPNPKPYSLSTPRNIPLPLRDKVKEELERMTKLGVISKVETPTEWCAGMVVVPKKSSGSIRICVDLRPLNENVMREKFPLPKVDEILAQLAGARVFSKLDANMGFWQIPLSPECRSLTTFITPFGRFHFNKLPFGVSCASELFQKRMAVILEGLEGVLCLVDDVLVFGSDQQEHDRRLRGVLERLNKARVTLNAEKCAFSRKEIKFMDTL
eukprot:Em0245g3a